jgi:hypothetical protein
MIQIGNDPNEEAQRVWDRQSLANYLRGGGQSSGGGGSMPMVNPSMFMGGGGSGGGLFSLGGGGAAAGSGPAGSITGGLGPGGGGGGIAGQMAGSGAGGGSSALGTLGPIGAIAAAVMLGKGIEYRNHDNGWGAAMRTIGAPTLNQWKADPKMALLGSTGLFPITNHFMNDEAKQAKPEWETWLGY